MQYPIGSLLVRLGCAATVGATIPVLRQASTIIGTWAGESRCLGARPACHDEHVVYHVTGGIRDSAIVDGARIAGRDTVSMGALQCAVDTARTSLLCHIPVGIWRFHVTQGQLEGSLTLSDSTAARRVLAHRVQPR